MKWLKRKLRKWVDDAREEPDVYIGNKVISSRDDVETFGEPMRFTLTKANGGFIVSTKRYDNRTDRSTGDNYIITDSDDLGDAISKIVTMEALKF